MNKDTYHNFLRIFTKKKEWNLPIPTPPSYINDPISQASHQRKTIVQLLMRWMLSTYVVDKALQKSPTTYHIEIVEKRKDKDLVFVLQNKIEDMIAKNQFISKNQDYVMSLKNEESVQSLHKLKINNIDEWLRYIWTGKLEEFPYSAVFSMKGKSKIPKLRFNTYSLEEITSILKKQKRWWLVNVINYHKDRISKIINEDPANIISKERKAKKDAKLKINASSTSSFSSSEKDCRCKCHCGTCHSVNCHDFKLNNWRETRYSMWKHPKRWNIHWFRLRNYSFHKWKQFKRKHKVKYDDSHSSRALWLTFLEKMNMEYLKKDQDSDGALCVFKKCNPICKQRRKKTGTCKHFTEEELQMLNR